MCPVIISKVPSWCKRAPWLQWWQLPLLSSPGFCWGGWQASATPCGSSAQCPTGISVTYPPPIADLCNASQITIDFMHENFSFLLPIPLVYSLNAETALTHFAYSLSNSPSKFPNLITATFSWLCRLRNPHTDMGETLLLGPSSPHLAQGCLVQGLSRKCPQQRT